MPEIDRLDGICACFELGFVDREATPKPLMKLAIQLQATGLSLSDTVSVLDVFGFERARSTVHNWVQKADLEPHGGKVPDLVAIDESVVWLNDEPFWLYAAVDPVLNEFLHVRLFPACNEGLATMFVSELLDRHQLDETEFLVDGAPWLHAALQRHGCRFRHETHGRRNVVERIFKEVKRLT